VNDSTTGAGYFHSKPGGDVREHPRPHALEDVVARTRNHLDATVEAVLPPGRALLPAVPRSVEEERLRAHHPRLGAIERWRRDEGEPFDEPPVRRGQLNGLPTSVTDADDCGRRAVPRGGQLDVALRGLARIGVGCSPAVGQAEHHANYERGLVLSGS
jgi:hypothetical protein